MTKEFKLEDLQEDLLLDLYKKFPNTIDDNARFIVEDLKYEKGKATKKPKFDNGNKRLWTNMWYSSGKKEL